MFFRDAFARVVHHDIRSLGHTIVLRCLSKQVVSVNPFYFDIRIDFIDEAIYFHTDLFSRDFPGEGL